MEYLELYNRAKSALAEAYTVDELSAIISQSDLINHAAKLAKDDEMIMMAQEIKLRAERRFGEVSKELEKSKGGWNNHNLEVNDVDFKTKQKTLESVGVSKQMANQYEKLADVPEQDFEVALSEYKQEGNLSRAKLMSKLKKPTPQPQQPKTLDITPERDRPISYVAQAMTLLNLHSKVKDMKTADEIIQLLRTEIHRNEDNAGWNLTKF